MVHGVEQISRPADSGERKVARVQLPSWTAQPLNKPLPVALGYKIKDQLPDARLVLIPHTKHLLTLERPRVCAEMLRQFQHDTLNGRLAAAHTVQTLDLNSFEDRLLVGSNRSATGVAR
jgi:hypothetical protein